MHKIVQIIKSWFGIYENGGEYTITLDKIIITPQFEVTHPHVVKVARKNRFYEEHKILPAPIVLDETLTLTDGYISYLICKNHKIKKVPVLIEFRKSR